MNTIYPVMRLYAHEIYAYDERHVMIFFFFFFFFFDWNIYFQKGCNNSNEASEMM